MKLYKITGTIQIKLDQEIYATSKNDAVEKIKKEHDGLIESCIKCEEIEDYL